MKTPILLGSLCLSFLLSGCGDQNKSSEGSKAHDHDHAHHDHAHGHDHGGSHAHGAPDMDSLLNVPEGAKVFFVEPMDGATLKSPFKVVFGIEGMAVKPAGTLEAGSGHHHLLINKSTMDKGQVIPADATHIHFGKGQTETELKLEPGQYQLTMQFADGIHRSLGAQMSKSIKVTVE